MKARIPQIKSTAKNLIVIAIVTICGGIVTAYAHGEIHKFADLIKAVYDGALYGLVTALGWLGMKSPLAHYAQGLLQQETISTTTAPGGVKTEETIKTTIETSTPVP